MVARVRSTECAAGTKTGRREARCEAGYRFVRFLVLFFVVAPVSARGDAHAPLTSCIGRTSAGEVVMCASSRRGRCDIGIVEGIPASRVRRRSEMGGSWPAPVPG